MPSPSHPMSLNIIICCSEFDHCVGRYGLIFIRDLIFASMVQLSWCWVHCTTHEKHLVRIVGACPAAPGFLSIEVHRALQHESRRSGCRTCDGCRCFCRRDIVFFIPFPIEKIPRDKRQPRFKTFTRHTPQQLQFYRIFVRSFLKYINRRNACN